MSRRGLDGRFAARLDRVEQRDGEFCAVSSDGARSFGCYATEGEANERLRQVEAAVAAKGDSVFRFDRLGPVHCDDTRSDGVFAELTPEGFLQCSALITRIGVFEYEDAEGNCWGEFRDANEVFAGQSLDSFRMVVITDDHPDEMVDTSNVGDVQVGHVGSDVRRDGDFVRASLTITDPDVIRSVQDGKVELSCGYFAQVVQDPGVAPDGTPFTSRQTNIRGNHLALVQQGRAGDACRLQLDSGDAITKQDIRMPKKKSTKKKSDERTDARVIVGGVEFDVPDEVAAALEEMTEKIEEQASALAQIEEPAAEEPSGEVEAEAEAIEAAVDADEPEHPAADADAEEAEHPKQDRKEKAMRDAMQAKIDSLEAKLDATSENQDARIDARVALVTACRKVLGDDVRTDGINEITLQKAVVIHVTPSMQDKLDGKSADYVRAAYEMALDAEAKRIDSSAELLELTNPANTVESDSSGMAAARDHMDQRFRNNYRKPAATEIN